MSVDHLQSGRTDARSGPRQDDLALRWESATGEARILARGLEALTLYQSDMAEGFRGVTGGFMVLGRVQDGGHFRPLIRQAIPLHVTVADAMVPGRNDAGGEDEAVILNDEAILVPVEGSIAETGLLALVIEATAVGQLDPGARLLA